MTSFERFSAMVKKGPDCWLWIGSTRGSRQKRGCFWDGHKNVDACRWIYAYLHPEICLNGLVVRHTCDNPLCVNPEHLIHGSQADNVRDMWERGRADKAAIRGGLAKGRAILAEHPEYRPRGDRHGLFGKGHIGTKNGEAKLTDDDVREIRRLAGTVTQRALAERFGVAQGVIWRAIHRKTWTHVE